MSPKFSMSKIRSSESPQLPHPPVPPMHRIRTVSTVWGWRNGVRA